MKCSFYPWPFQSYNIWISSTLVNKLENHGNMRIQTARSNRWEIIFTINALKQSKATSLDGRPVELFLAVLVVSARLELLLIWKFWEFVIFPSEWNKEIVFKISKKSICFECHSWRGFYARPALARVLANIILEPSKDRKKTVWFPLWIFMYRPWGINSVKSPLAVFFQIWKQPFLREGCQGLKRCSYKYL